jgi:hypothetical protein
VTPPFITDENIPLSVSRWLKANGHDVEKAAEALRPVCDADLGDGYPITD